MGVDFTEQLGSNTLESILNLHEHFKGELPKLEKNELVLVGTFAADGSPAPVSASEIQDPGEKKLHGVHFSRVKPDGKPSWALRIDLNSLTVHCLEYSGWDVVWPRSLSYIQTLATVLADKPVSNIRCQFLDQFVFEGDSGSSSAEWLFNSESRFVTKQCFESGSLWHTHQGWFDQTMLTTATARTLNQINIDALLQSSRDITNINHTMIYQFKDSINFVELLNTQVGSTVTDIENVMNHLHTNNKFFLSDLLVPEMCERINLNNEGAS